MKVLAKLADHACVLSTLPHSMEERVYAPRRIWKMADANWTASSDRLHAENWHMLNEGSVDEALTFLYQK